MSEEKKDLCVTCVFFGPNSAGSSTGSCRRAAPRPNVENNYAVFPKVDDDDWCGEWIGEGGMAFKPVLRDR